jgi:hypothetical protein
MVQEMMQFDQNGEKCENFYRRVASVLSRAVIYKVMDDILDRVLTGWRPHQSRGAYFVVQLKNIVAHQGVVLGQRSLKV